MSLTSQAGKSVSRKISEFIARIQIKDIPREVRDIAKLHLLDGLATMIAGVKEESSRLLRRHFFGQGTAPEATVLGTARKCSAEHAALINGVQGHVLDYDDAQLASLPSRPMGQQTHPTTPVLAATLALAESRRASGLGLLDSYIVGVEVACRLGDAIDPIHYRNGFHPTGTIGIFGATAACAHLLRLRPKSITHALGVAASLASGLRANRGTMAKGLNAGRAAENGLLAAKLASIGFTASQNIFDEPMGFFSAMCQNRFDARLLRFGKPFFFVNPGVAIKLYPCAGVMHPALDVILDIQRRHLIKAENVEKVRVALDGDAALPLVYPTPGDSVQAKFSLHFALAVALTEGAAGLEQFTDQRVRDPDIRTLMKRIKLVRRPKGKRGPGIGIPTEVEILLKNRARHRGHAAIPRGHPRRPDLRAAVEAKFRQCAHGVLSERHVSRFLQTYSEIERAPSISAWLQPLRPPRR